MQSHVNHEDAVTIPKTEALILIILAKLLLYAAHASSNLPKLQQSVVSWTQDPADAPTLGSQPVCS